MGVTVANLPVTFWANYARNLADDVEYDTAYAVGAMVGKASDARTWEAGLFYQEIDKDALFAQWIDSDFGDGKTDSEGLVLKAGYAPVKNFTDERHVLPEHAEVRTRSSTLTTTGCRWT